MPRADNCNGRDVKMFPTALACLPQRQSAAGQAIGATGRFALRNRPNSIAARPVLKGKTAHAATRNGCLWQACEYFLPARTKVAARQRRLQPTPAGRRAPSAAGRDSHQSRAAPHAPTHRQERRHRRNPSREAWVCHAGSPRRGPPHGCR